MNMPDEDMAILNAAAPYINASLFNASDILEIYRREMARSDDIDKGVQKVGIVEDKVIIYITFPYRQNIPMGDVRIGDKHP